MPAPTEVVPTRSSDHVSGAAASLVVAAVWIALALWRPTSTYHFAPLIAAGAWPYVLRRGAVAAVRTDAARAAAGGFVIAVVAGVVLVPLDALRGPTFWGDGHALVEVVPMALVGAGLGLGLARSGSR